MEAEVLNSAFSDFLDKVVERMTPQEILAFQFSEEDQENIRNWVERNNAGTITSEELARLQQILQIERMMTVLKAKAFRALRKS